MMENMIILNTIDETDLSILRGWRINPGIYKWCRQTGPISKLDQIEWYKKQHEDPTIRMFKIVLIDGNSARPVGACGLTSIDLINRRAEFSCYIAYGYQKKGYAWQALQYLFQFGFFDLGMNVIWGETFDGNPAMKLFKKMGMVHEGTRRSFYYKNGKYIDAHLISIGRKEFNDRH